VIAELNKNLGTALEPEYFENPYSFYQPHTEADMTFAKTELNYSCNIPRQKESLITSGLSKAGFDSEFLPESWPNQLT
jgi:hypothetical protein